MTDHKEAKPTNEQILIEVRAMHEALFKVTNDVNELKTWRIAQEAVEAYKRTEADRRPVESSEPKGDSKTTAELLRNLGIALAIILTLISSAKGAGL